MLSRGLISGHWRPGASGAADFRSHSPRFQPGNVEQNLALVELLRALAHDHDATPAQIAIAWVAAQGVDIVPLVGARRRDRLAEALGATALTLSPADLTAIGAAIPADAVAGGRYAEAQLAMLDSER